MPQKNNFNDTTPAAPAGTVNVKWQADAPADQSTTPYRNASGYVPHATASAAGVIQLEPSLDSSKVFKGDGTWGTSAGGSTPSRSTTTKVTASLAAGATENGTVVLAKTFGLIQVVVSGPARVRLYATAAARTADAGRSQTTPPTAGTQHGVITDLYLDTSDKWTWTMSPLAEGSNNEASPTTSISYAITNIGVAAAAITASFTFATEES